ncbi:3-ketodihydrosphingosine reductase [Parabacteroides pacaensis]|uniref:3-ketodihydrosphingosine reductase n=1 Tax=Parabacteroides pacaensis TaxID=2086575 RepID=UPI000D0F18B2|nr:SDR family oxidoreductase [Parabacteroides pacaensis]
MNDRQVILITGASSGFGRISALTLAKEGHIVYGTSRKECTSGNEGIKMLVMDVTSPESVEAAVDLIIKQQGRIDVVINNAGIGISGALELITREESNLQMDTNFMGTVYVCNAVLPLMRKARRGKIINISSIGGMIAVPFQGFYSASKFALEGYSEALALEVAPFNIQVCLVEPGDFRTGFTMHRQISSVTLEHEDYRDAFVRTMGVIEQAEQAGANPEKLAKTLCKLVRASRPAFRTKVGPIGQVAIATCKGWLPGSFIRFLLRRFYKLGRKR